MNFNVNANENDNSRTQKPRKSHHMNLKQGTILQGGKYRIVRFISSGGFGCTYEAEHVMLDERVAIKEFFVKDFCNRDEATAHVTVGTQSKKGLIDKQKRTPNTVFAVLGVFLLLYLI